MNVDAHTNAASGSGGGSVNGVAVGVNPNNVNGTGSGAVNAARSETLAQVSVQKLQKQSVTHFLLTQCLSS